MAYSIRCKDLQTYYNRHTKQCIPCDMKWIKPGFEFVPNCGYVDDGGRRDSHTRECADNSWNNGRNGKCQTCSPCPTGAKTLRHCNATVDTQCCSLGQNCNPSVKQDIPMSPGSLTLTLSIMAPIILLACCLILVLTYFIHKRKNKSCQVPQVSAAPLGVVLDDLDVLEELVILLDPEGQGVKCTRHLASYCSFPATWINYTYSMRDSKSPLKTLLEGVTTKYPEWTVGHLARMLEEMGRTDAIVVLAKLRQTVYTV